MFLRSARTTSDTETMAVPGRGGFKGPHGMLVSTAETGTRVHQRPGRRTASPATHTLLPSCSHDRIVTERARPRQSHGQHLQMDSREQRTAIRAEEGERGAILKRPERVVVLCLGLVCGVLCFVSCCIQDSEDREPAWCSSTEKQIKEAWHSGSVQLQRETRRSSSYHSLGNVFQMIRWTWWVSAERMRRKATEETRTFQMRTPSAVCVGYSVTN